VAPSPVRLEMPEEAIGLIRRLYECLLQQALLPFTDICDHLRTGMNGSRGTGSNGCFK
jgi:hypothetical protein